MTKSFFLFGILTLALGTAGAEPLAVRTAMDPTDFAHVRCSILGRNHWMIQGSGYYTIPEREPDKPYHNPELRKLGMFSDCGLYVGAARGIPENGEGASVTWRTVRENWCDLGPKGDAVWMRVDPVFKPGYPKIVVFPSKRNFRAMSGKIDLDYEDYANFLKTHPEVVAFMTCAEIDNEVNTLPGRIRNMPEGPVKARLSADWPAYTPKSREGLFALAKQWFDRRVALYYGDLSRAASERCVYSLEHATADWGVSQVVVETTGQCQDNDPRWDVMGMFCRGAARQFDLPWNWFIAIISTGYSKDLSYFGSSSCCYNQRPRSNKYWRPEGGLSRSLLNRLQYYAYLNGANFIQYEGGESFLTFNSQPGLEQLTDRGRDVETFHAFTRKHPDRGGTFAHCAILTPIDLMYTEFGGVCGGGNVPYSVDDYMVDGVFFTAVPACTTGHRQLAKIGVESNYLHNAELAMSYDVLCPDARQKKDKFPKTVAKYPVAYLTGAYAKNVDITTPLTEYVRNGGTLVLNAVYLDRFPKDFAGVRWDGKSLVGCGKRATDDDGRSFDVDADYEVAAFEPCGAKPVLTDETGRALVLSHAYGKGRVLVTAPLHMAPKRPSWDLAGRMETVGSVKLGRIGFVFNRWLFGRLQDELFPVRVTGDCQYGINRTKTGWWLWALNNKGVSKFVDTFETVDATQTSPIRVESKGLRISSVRELLGDSEIATDGVGFDGVVPAGGVVVYELKEM